MNNNDYYEEDDDEYEYGNEPYYVPFEDNIEKKPPKWKTPKTEIAKQALGACGRKYYKTKQESSDWRIIEKSSLPIASGLDSVYPREWIELMIEWAKSKNKLRTIIVFPQLIFSIKNKAAITDFKVKWRKEHKEEIILRKITLTGNEEKVEW